MRLDARLIRHLVRRVIPIALAVNVAINAVVAALVYREPRLPIVGKRSIADDTFVAAFLIGFITLVAVAPAARREALAGRARGRGWRRLAWLERHWLVAATLFGAACVLGLAWPSIWLLAQRGVLSLSRGQFIVWKTAFAGAAGTVAAVAAALLAALPVAPADVPGKRDRRWADERASVDGPTYPCDYIDKGGLAVTDRARGCSGTPTWQLVVAGALDPTHVRIALADTVTRYPSLRCKVQSLDGVPPHARRYRYAADARFSVDDIFAVAEARDPAALAALTHEQHNRHLELYDDFPVTLTLARTADDACRLFFRQHHAIADGRAFIGLLVDFAAFLDDARRGRRPSPEALAPIGRRSEADALGLSTPTRLRYIGQGWLRVLAAAARDNLLPVEPFAQNRSNDYTGDNGTVHWIVGDDVLERWNAARKRLGVSLNSLLTAALIVANRRWHVERAQPIGRTRGLVLMETRPRDGAFRSFANHLASLDVWLDLRRLDDVGAIAQLLQRQVAAQRRRHVAEQRLLAERRIVAGMSIAQMQRYVFETARTNYNFNFSNLIPLDFPSLRGDGWSVDEVLITTPVSPRTGMALTVIRYNGRLFFNFNYKASAFSRDDTDALSRHFRDILAACAP